jgi:SPP1 family predicted phage head-tail adaptor
MRAGTLRHLVTIQSKSATIDGYGGPVDTWSDVCTVHASIEPLAGREFIAAQAVNIETTGKIRIRYRSDVTAAMRVVFGTRLFNITAPPINPNERNQELILMVSEKLNEG